MMNKQKSGRKQKRWSSVLVLIGVIGGLALVADDGFIPFANAQDDLVYVPLDSPCRIVFTPAPGLVPGVSQDFLSYGSAGSLNSQGGNASGCEHPRSSEGIQPAVIAANVIAVGAQAAGGGNIRAYPAGAASPLASTVNFTDANIGNFSNIALRTSDGRFTMESAFNDIRAVVDVVGYFYPMQGAIKAVDANNLVIGEFLALEEGGDLNVFTTKEYLEIGISMTPEISPGAQLFYLTSDCTGVPYTETSNGSVFLAYQPDTVYAKYYVPKNSVAQYITPVSYATEFSGPCQILGAFPGWYFPAFLNVPTITGVANIMYTVPITIQRQ